MHVFPSIEVDPWAGALYQSTQDVSAVIHLPAARDEASGDLEELEADTLTLELGGIVGGGHVHVSEKVRNAISPRTRSVLQRSCLRVHCYRAP